MSLPPLGYFTGNIDESPSDEQVIGVQSDSQVTVAQPGEPSNTEQFSATLAGNGEDQYEFMSESSGYLLESYQDTNGDWIAQVGGSDNNIFTVTPVDDGSDSYTVTDPNGLYMTMPDESPGSQITFSTEINTGGGPSSKQKWKFKKIDSDVER